MANETRVRSNFAGGLVEDNPLSSSATTLTSAGLVSLPAVGSTQHMALILDPDGVGGNPEIAYVTAHTALATTATIVKGQEGTAARDHARDTPWLHGPTVLDFIDPAHHLDHDHQRISDDFARADSSGSLGVTTVHEREWQGDSGWNITGEYAHRTSGYDVAYIEPHQEHGAWEVEAGPGCTGGEWWAVVRYTSGTNSYVRVGRTPTENLYVVQKIDAGGLGTFDLSVAKNEPWPAPAVGDVVRVVAHRDDGIDVYINDLLIWTGQDSMNAAIARCGIASTGSVPTIARVAFLPI